MNNILIIIPRLDTSGPVRGAIAASNYLASNNSNVTLYCIFPNLVNIHSLGINENVDLIINNDKSIIHKLSDLKHLKKSNNYSLVISYCFISDFLSLLTKTNKNEYIYVRGNLLLNYFYDDGLIGIFKFFIHISIIFLSRNVLVLNESYKNFLRFFLIKAYIIPNIIDESKYIQRKCKHNNYNFLFVGSLSARKNIMILVNEFAKYVQINKDASLTIYGNGPLYNKLFSYIRLNKLENKIILKGSIDNVFNIFKDYDYFLLPSFSEGTSRASLEALFCGLPILLFDVDSNKDLITKRSGILINKNTPIFDGLKKLSKINPSNSSLLGDKYKAENLSKNVRNIFEENKINKEKKTTFLSNFFSLNKYNLYSSTFFNYISKISSSFLFLFILFLSASNYTSAEITLWFFITALSGMFYFIDLGISAVIYNSKISPKLVKSGINFYLNLTFIYILFSSLFLYFFINKDIISNKTILENKILIISSICLFFINNFLLMFEKFNISKLKSKNHYVFSTFTSIILIFIYWILSIFNLTNFFISVIFCFSSIFFTNLYYLIIYLNKNIIDFYLINSKDYRSILNVLKKSYGYFLTQIIYVLILGSDLILCSLFASSDDKYNFFLIHKLLQILILPLIFLNILSWSHLADLKKKKGNLILTEKKILAVNVIYFSVSILSISLFINPIFSFFKIQSINYSNFILFTMFLRSFIEIAYTYFVSLMGYRSNYKFSPLAIIVFMCVILAIKYIFYDNIYINIIYTSFFTILFFIIYLNKSYILNKFSR